MGKIVALDATSTFSTRQVRICVEVNLSSTLPKFVEVKLFQYQVIFLIAHTFLSLLNGVFTVQSKMAEKRPFDQPFLQTVTLFQIQVLFP